jgi:hypothetical protein
MKKRITFKMNPLIKEYSVNTFQSQTDFQVGEIRSGVNSVAVFEVPCLPARDSEVLVIYGRLYGNTDKTNKFSIDFIDKNNFSNRVHVRLEPGGKEFLFLFEQNFPTDFEITSGELVEFDFVDVYIDKTLIAKEHLIEVNRGRGFGVQ